MFSDLFGPTQREKELERENRELREILKKAALFTELMTCNDEKVIEPAFKLLQTELKPYMSLES